jgi:hypothetical protein
LSAVCTHVQVAITLTTLLSSFYRKPILMSGLLDAAFDGDLATVKRLLADGTASINECDEFGSSAFLVGAAGGQLATVQWLLELGGSSIGERDQGGRTALICAVALGHMSVVQWLLTTGGAYITDATDDGDTCLHVAASNGHMVMIKWLITEVGADANEASNAGRTPLIAALAHGHYALSRWLIEEGGASVSQSNAAGEKNVWRALCEGLGEDADTADLAALLKVMVLIDDAPDVIAKVSPAHAKIVMRGRQLRAQLPSYLERQRALVAAHCPLPTALQPLVAGYAAPTPEDMWAEGGLCIRAP